MMAGHAGYAISGAGNGHFCGLERGIVCGSKTPVLRKTMKGRVSQIAGYETANFAKFLNACPVAMNLSVL